jgi:thiamine biosynthesis lipoprotein ApbE
VTNASGLNNHHTDTLTAIFQHPASHNIRWVDVVHLVEAAGEVDERHDGRFKFTIGSQSEVFNRPKDKDIGIEQIEDLRRMFRATEFEPKKPGKEQ